MRCLQVCLPMDLHGEVQPVEQGAPPLARLVRRHDAAGVPVRPVDLVLEHGERERVREALDHQSPPVRAVDLGALDHVVPGVGPVDPLAVRVECQPVRPVCVFGYDGFPIRAVHACAFNSRIRTWKTARQYTVIFKVAFSTF